MNKSDISGWSVLGFAILGFIFIWIAWYIPAIISIILAFVMIFLSNYYSKKEEPEPINIEEETKWEKGPTRFSCRNEIEAQ